MFGHCNLTGEFEHAYMPPLPPIAGHYEVQIAYTVSRSRSTTTPVRIVQDNHVQRVVVNQKDTMPNVDTGFLTLGRYLFQAGSVHVIVSNEDTDGKVIVDAVRVACADSLSPAPTSAPTVAPTSTPTAEPDLLDGPCAPGEVLTVVDDTDSGAELIGSWKPSTCTGCNYFGSGFVHDGRSGKGSKAIIYHLFVPSSGQLSVQMAWTQSRSRSDAVPVTITHADGQTQLLVDQRAGATPIDGLFAELGVFRFVAGTTATVRIDTGGTSTDDKVVGDAVRLVCPHDGSE